MDSVLKLCSRRTTCGPLCGVLGGQSVTAVEPDTLRCTYIRVRTIGCVVGRLELERHSLTYDGTGAAASSEAASGAGEAGCRFRRPSPRRGAVRGTPPHNPASLAATVGAPRLLRTANRVLNPPRPRILAALAGPGTHRPNCRTAPHQSRITKPRSQP